MTTEYTRRRIGSGQREAIQLVENIDDALLRLEIWPDRARMAIPVIEDILSELDDGSGIEERDQWRAQLLSDLVVHLRKVHGMNENEPYLQEG